MSPRYALASALVLILSACDGGSTAPSPPPVVELTGDSVTYFWNDAAWQADRDELISAHLPGVIDTGIGGQTCAEIAARFQTDVIDKGPSVIVIGCGMNDITRLHSSDPAPLFAMADAANKAGIEVIIATITPANFEVLYAPNADEYQRLRASWNEQIFAGQPEHDYRVVDYAPAMVLANGEQNPELFYTDGIHPVSAGYAVMWRVLSGVL